MNKKELFMERLNKFVLDTYYDEQPRKPHEIVTSTSYRENVLKYSSIVIDYEGIECLIESNQSMNLQDFLVNHLLLQNGDSSEDLTICIEDIIFEYYKDHYFEDMLYAMSKRETYNRIDSGQTFNIDNENGEGRWVTKFGVFSNAK